jgi:YtcA family
MSVVKPMTLAHMNVGTSSTEPGGAFYRFAPAARLWRTAPMLGLLGGCDGAPSRNILGSYFPSWMVCALVGIALALAARAIFKALGILEELPVPFVVMLAIACAGTFAMWLIWLS